MLGRRKISMIKIFSTIVRSKVFYFDSKTNSNHFVKYWKYKTSIFLYFTKYYQVTKGAIINKSKKPLATKILGTCEKKKKRLDDALANWHTYASKTGRSKKITKNIVFNFRKEECPPFLQKEGIINQSSYRYSTTKWHCLTEKSSSFTSHLRLNVSQKIA